MTELVKLCTKQPWTCARTSPHTVFDYGGPDDGRWPFAMVRPALAEHLMTVEPGRYFYGETPKPVSAVVVGPVVVESVPAPVVGPVEVEAAPVITQAPEPSGEPEPPAKKKRAPRKPKGE